MGIASFVPSDKKHLLCHVNPWLLSSTHSTSDLHLISHWVTVQTFHKCSYAVKHENMNFVFCFFFNTHYTECYSVYRQMFGTVNMTVVVVCTDRWLVLLTWPWLSSQSSQLFARIKHIKIIKFSAVPSLNSFILINFKVMVLKDVTEPLSFYLLKRVECW
jgi:hypothetical protein